MATETFEVEGHIIDSLILAKVLDMFAEAGRVNWDRNGFDPRRP